jgi:hypothetical protein
MGKARVFVGSSREGLEVANAIQVNLEHDAVVTVWNQGIFELSKSALENLVEKLAGFDYGIFVFHPDDVTKIRNESARTVRDNVVFEMGLFMGKLGRKRTFFVQPSSVADFHLPSDLTGIQAGLYDNYREDGNLTAALGPFCSQIRGGLKSFVREKLGWMGLESERAIEIAVNKPDSWEFRLIEELLRTKLLGVTSGYKELKAGLVFTPTTILTDVEFIDWLNASTQDFLRLVEILQNIFDVELIDAVGPPGTPGDAEKIRVMVERIADFCRELLAWERNMIGITPPQELKPIKDKLRGWSSSIIEDVQAFVDDLRDKMVAADRGELSGQVEITLQLRSPAQIEDINNMMRKRK